MVNRRNDIRLGAELIGQSLAIRAIMLNLPTPIRQGVVAYLRNPETLETFLHEGWASERFGDDDSLVFFLAELKESIETILLDIE